ncbi:MAG TPA: sodium/glutamate symporter [Steroidobacteraceae bacterium]
MFTLNEIQTVAFAGLTLFAGFGVLRLCPALNRYSIPAPVIGGLLVALAALAARRLGTNLFSFDTGLQTPLMIAFFTSIGFSASLSLLKRSGGPVVMLLGMAALLAILQNVVGILVAKLFGLHPLFGVIVGATTLAGGPSTGLAFAPAFEQAGVAGAASIAIASAMAGIVCGGLLGGPVATWLLRHYRLVSFTRSGSSVERAALEEGPPIRVEPSTDPALKELVVMLSTMWVGSALSDYLTAAGVVLPPYIGAMIIGAFVRNIDDRTGWLNLSHAAIARIGHVALSFFLALALMNLKLWQLSGLLLPLLLNMALQILLVAAFCFWPLFKIMGRDFDSAVICGGFVGFMLGITANAMAVMQALVDRNGPAPRAFLVVPLVGAFFIDFSNAIIITVSINAFR